MGISPKTAGFLKDIGYQALHLQEEGLGRLSDFQILEKALRDGYILLTLSLFKGDLFLYP